MIVFYNVAEEAGWTGFVFARLQDRHGPLRAALITTVFFWLFHLPTFVVETDSWVGAGVLMGFLLLPHLASRFIVGWLYNSTGGSVLIAGLFHATFNSTINPTGFALGAQAPTGRGFHRPQRNGGPRRSSRGRRDEGAPRPPIGRTRANPFARVLNPKHDPLQ